MLKGSARTFGDLHFSYLPEAKRPANRWQQMKKKWTPAYSLYMKSARHIPLVDAGYILTGSRSLSPRRSFSPNTSFELPYRTRSPVCSSSDEDEKIEVGNRASRSPAPSPSLGSCTDVEWVGSNILRILSVRSSSFLLTADHETFRPHNKEIDPACYVDNLDLDPDASSISEGQKYDPVRDLEACLATSETSISTLHDLKTNVGRLWRLQLQALVY